MRFSLVLTASAPDDGVLRYVALDHEDLPAVVVPMETYHALGEPLTLEVVAGARLLPRPPWAYDARSQQEAAMRYAQERYGQVAPSTTPWPRGSGA